MGKLIEWMDVVKGSVMNNQVGFMGAFKLSMAELNFKLGWVSKLSK